MTYSAGHRYALMITGKLSYKRCGKDFSICMVYTAQLMLKVNGGGVMCVAGTFDG